jgi:vacuolar-type H+-ATPase subunit I/STV1
MVEEILRPKFGTTLTVDDRPHKCKHHSVEVGSKKRIVVCTACGEYLDAFEILLQYAYDERRFNYHRGQLAEIEKKIAELQAEEKRVKARLKRATKKDAERCEVKEICPLVKQLEYAIRVRDREIMQLKADQ